MFSYLFCFCKDAQNRGVQHEYNSASTSLNKHFTGVNGLLLWSCEIIQPVFEAHKKEDTSTIISYWSHEAESKPISSI